VLQQTSPQFSRHRVTSRRRSQRPKVSEEG
jgi:hypothetical protein